MADLEDRDTMLVILGAGASFDCIPHEGMDRLSFKEQVLDAEVQPRGLPALSLANGRPPMTQQLSERKPLLNWALNRWRWARPVVDYLRQELAPHRRSGTQ